MKLQVRELARHFGDLKAVDGISFELGGGEIYGFVGPNGAGKTTTMRILATLDEPTSGDAFLDGSSILQQPEEARHAIGFMPDSLPTHHDITVFEYLDFFARAYGLHGASRRRVVASVMEFTRLGSIRDTFIKALSKGLKQRVSLARSLVHDPTILVLDEPAAGLDPRARVELRELLLALAKQDKAILISSHILTELSEICDGAVIIEHGRIIQAGRITDLLDAAAEHWTVRVRCLDTDEDRDRDSPPEGNLARELLTAPHVDQVRPVGDELEVDLAGSEEVGHELLAYLIGRGHKVVEFRRVRTGLEHVFMQVTKGGVAQGDDVP